MKTKLYQRAFSLVEILAAVAVLALLSLMLVQIIDSAAKSTRHSARAIDAAGQARLAFDRMALDINSMFRRSDMDYEFRNAPFGADMMKFYSGVASSGGNRRISLVAYRMDGDTSPLADKSGKRVLQRAAVGVNWGDRGFMGLTPTGNLVRFSSPGNPVTVLPADFTTLAEGVLRCVIGFQLSKNSGASQAGDVLYVPPVRIVGAVDTFDWSVVGHLVVGVVATDLEARKLLTVTNINAIATAFPTPAANDLPVASWQPISQDISNFPGMPLPAVQSIRVFQRFIPIQQGAVLP